MIALYHRVMRRENFEKAAKDLFDLLRSAQIQSPDCPRALFVDIDGHRNDQGGFDSDMCELQKEFGVGFLGKYFTEAHFPLIEFKNPNPQCNDIPQTLELFNAENKTDNSLDKLFIENYSNTEFLSETDVYKYVKRVRVFLIKYKEYDHDCKLHENNTGKSNYIRLWKNHINDLINELYNVFLFGNLISAAAVTRTLIECFVYFSILTKEGNEHLIHEWYLCSTCCSFWPNKEKAKEFFKVYCDANGLDFDKKWETYTYNDTVNANRWLRPIIPSGKLSFKAACEYLKDDHIYKDYESAYEFVHGQDIKSKVLPFTFYSSIAYRFYMMMFYIYRTVRLFPLNDYLKNEIYELENDLFDLIEKYCK